MAVVKTKQKKTCDTDTGNEQSVKGLAFYLQSLKLCLVTLATVSDSGASLMRKRNERDD